MPTLDEVRRASELRRQTAGNQPTLEQVQAASRRRNRGTLSLDKPQPYMPGTTTMGAPDPSDTRTMGQRLRQAAATVAVPIMESAQGISELMGYPVMPWRDSTPQQEAARYEALIAQLKREQLPEGPGRTAGNIIGEAIQFAGPGGVGAKVGTKLATSVPRLAASPGARTAAAATGEAAGIGAFEAAATPGAPGERLRAGLTAGAGSLAGSTVGTGVGRTVQKVREGVRRTPQAQQMIDEGVPLTPGQASQGESLRWLEEQFGFFPGMAGSTGRMQENAARAWNQNLLQSTFRDIPGAEQVRITTPGPEGFKQAQKGFGQLYDDFWERGYNRLGPDRLETIAPQLAEQVTFRAKQVLDDNAAQRISRYMRDRSQALAKNPSAQTLQKFNRDLQDYAAQARNRQEFTEAGVIEGAIQELENLFGDSAQALRQINKGYRNLKTLEKAASYKVNLGEGYFTPDSLVSAVKARGTERQLAAGGAPLQSEAMDAMETIGTLVPRGKRLGERFATPAVGVGLYLEPATTVGALAAGRAAVTDPMRRALTGQTNLQQWLGTKDLEQLRRALARIGGPTGAAVAAQQER